jgi:hypothetical protein
MKSIIRCMIILIAFIILLTSSGCNVDRNEDSPFIGTISTSPEYITSDFQELNIEVQVINSSDLKMNPLMFVVIPSKNSTDINILGAFAKLESISPIPRTYTKYINDIKDIYKGELFYNGGLMDLSPSKSRAFYQAIWTIPNEYVNEQYLPSIEIYVLLFDKKNKMVDKQHVSVNYQHEATFKDNPPQAGIENPVPQQLEFTAVPVSNDIKDNPTQAGIENPNPQKQEFTTAPVSNDLNLTPEELANQGEHEFFGKCLNYINMEDTCQYKNIEEFEIDHTVFNITFGENMVEVNGRVFEKFANNKYFYKQNPFYEITFSLEGIDIFTPEIWRIVYTREN